MKFREIVYLLEGVCPPYESLVRYDNDVVPVSYTHLTLPTNREV